MFLSPVTHMEMEGIISNLDLSKSIGPFSIPITLLKVLKHHIFYPLAKLINQSLVKGIVPSKLKVAKVIPIFKQRDLEINPIIDLSPYYQYLTNCMRK